MMRLFQLRRSFSLEFFEDTATVFLHEIHEDHNPIYSSFTKSPYLLGPNNQTVANLSGNMTTAVHWHDEEDIDDALAADFDGSLSGLGVELGTSSFNMSEALLALPSLKHENSNHLNHHNHSPSVSHHGSHSPLGSNKHQYNETAVSLISNHSSQDDGRPVAVVHGKKNRLAAYGHDDDNVTSAIKRFCVSNDRENELEASRYVFAGHNLNRKDDTECSHEECANDIRCQHRHSNSAPDLRTSSIASNVQVNSAASSPSSSTSAPCSVLSQILAAHHSNYGAPASPTLAIEQNTPHFSKSSHQFQYVLAASTSMATKIHEETMTYLNQGQSYEIKLKKLGDISKMKGKLLKSVIRVGFHERRLQYMERDLMSQWKQQRPTERILEVDIPLSYGIMEVTHDLQNINKSEFIWDPTKESGVFVKVNCISTEFTPKKHGGEKGVPFRIIIETHSYYKNSKVSVDSCLHAASCQVKVFKPKGADRKHKTDREKMNKRPATEREKYQSSYDYTIFTEYPLDSLYWTSWSTPVHNTSNNVLAIGNSNDIIKSSSPQHISASRRDSSSSNDKISNVVDFSSLSSLSSSFSNIVLSSEANSLDTSNWLVKNRFDSYVKTFSNFSGSDILRLTRDDLIQICGLTDGIRLYNSLHSRNIRPRLTLYICTPSDEMFRAIYLENLTVDEFAQKLTAVLGDPIVKIKRICINRPSGIRVLLTDDVVRNLTEESMFIVELVEDLTNEKGLQAILKSYK